MIDTHCHLQLIDKADEAIRNAQRVGIKHLITVSVENDDYLHLQKFRTQYPKYVSYSCGVHPLYCYNTDAIQVTDDCIAIGETGLDFYREHDQDKKNIQKKMFRQHLQLAQDLSKPVIIHTRNAAQDTLAIMQEFPKVIGVMHCFCEDYTIAQQAIAMGYYISFAGVLTYKSAHTVRNTAQLIPLDRILIETDSPYLTPSNLKRVPNEPQNIIHTLKILSQLRNTCINDMKTVTTNNAKKLFQIDNYD